ncbi:hypothetical protein AAG906_039017 [Vitis piasezkii]
MLLPVYLQVASSIAVAPVCTTNEADVGWMNEIETYLRTGDLPEETTHFTLIGNSLYRRSFGGLYLKCLNNTEAHYVLAKLHEGFGILHAIIANNGSRFDSIAFKTVSPRVLLIGF